MKKTILLILILSSFALLFLAGCQKQIITLPVGKSLSEVYSNCKELNCLKIIEGNSSCVYSEYSYCTLHNYCDKNIIFEVCDG